MYSLQFLEDILIPLGVCVVLPVLVVWLVMRKKTNETNRRAEIIMAAINKGSDIDTDKLLDSLETSGKQAKDPRAALKEKLMRKLLIAFILIGLGITFCLLAAITDYQGGSSSEEIEELAFAAAAFLLTGAAFLLSYFISRKFLAEELGLADKSGETEAGAPEEGDNARQDGAEQPAAAEKEN